ncbi:C-terminal binding protein [Plantactinospora sp. S1510]|uniref:C-terminal binding protein n=1 Tax=Plantactinospora alkalitolerans TaxID=2789879 RepID=A0ABS0GVQ5_9ACTN|nr:NAD(P)-dependent oxidoreductase [Plantactinospora alkalitolerans]MBF9130270.1 C-terminal binding protein [Plantactinospora alkalitolerans]
MAESPVVVVFDPLPHFSYREERAILEAGGARLVVPATEAEARAAIADADVVVVTGRRRFTAAEVATLSRCVGVQTSSVGSDYVDPSLHDRGIPLRTAAGYCTEEVSDHAVALLLAAWRRIPMLDRAGRRAGWAGGAALTAPLRRLRGRTVGIVGLGRIGRMVAAKARGLGLEAVGHDPFLTAGAVAPTPLVDLDALLAAADAVVLCAPATAESRHLLDARRLALTRPGVILVNVARGGLVDEAALVAALDSGQVAVAALDVRELEPPTDGDPLADRPDTILTPHAAASSVEAVAELHEWTARGALDLLRAAGRL